MPRWLIVEVPDGFPDPGRQPVDFELASEVVTRAVAACSEVDAGSPVTIRASFRRAPDPVALALDLEGVTPS
jgi:hypothetical protein